MELRHETEQLVEVIYARGGYASRDDVVLQAVQQLHERMQAAPLGDPARTRLIARRNWAILAALLQLVITIIAVIACAAEVESILFSGPAMSLSGLATVGLARPLCSRRVMVYGLSAPIVSALAAAMILLNGWGPSQAQEPISLVASLYTIFVAIPAAIAALPIVARWQNVREDSRAFRWQFSLRSLLVVTTAACVLLPVLRFAFAEPSPGDVVVFGIFILIAIALVGASLFVFANDLSALGVRRAGKRPLENAASVSVKHAAASQQADSRPETPPEGLHRLDKFG